MTYNIRLDVASDGENRWSERKDILLDEIQFLSPNIFGIQEGLPHQTTYLKDNLDNYDYIGIGRDGGEKGEFSALFYDTRKFTVEQSNTFWLSETPDKFSMGWDAAYPRICTYGLFADKVSGDKFWVFNAHLDHKGIEARQQGLALIREKIKILNVKELPVILMGDFNTEPEHIIMKDMQLSMLDSYKNAKFKYGSIGTFNGFKTDEIAKRRIDYIFISKSSEYAVRNYAVLSNLINNRYASDHFPVFIRLEKTGSSNSK
ncbi:endonuclease/exonuclease/phosphatase family protein [Maribacter sp. Asnod1-A12]|uniref:endonuclease/exonuclease/phosphatase family protein n=1 Tax=Maribacter sp. Asnod1-A12 TaxID=3160576 RepID=UPI0038639810